MMPKCFLFGVRRDDVYWLENSLLCLGRYIVDVPTCRLLSVHHEAGSRQEPALLVDGSPITPDDSVLFFGLPQVPKLVEPHRLEFAASEWLAALESVLSMGIGRVPNGSWLLSNCSLRSSDVFWTRACQKLCSELEPRLDWPLGSLPLPNADSLKEAVLTRKGVVTVPPNIWELTTSPMATCLVHVQELMYEKNLDFIRLLIEIRQDGVANIVRASAELPRAPSPTFALALRDFL